MFLLLGRLNVVLEEKKVSGRDLHQVCNPVGLNDDILQVKNTNGSANRKLAWLGAIVQYTPWVEYYGIYHHIYFFIVNLYISPLIIILPYACLDH